MKSLLKKILYTNVPVTEYAGITIREDISEKVFLRIDEVVIDVSKDHWALCLKPVTFGIWLHSDISFSRNSSYTLLFKERQQKLAEVKLDFFKSIEEQDGTLLLLRLTRCRLYHTSLIKQLFLFRRHYSKPGFSFSTFKSYVAAFSYPRKVSVISFQDGDYYTIFPMDFVGNPGGKGRYVFGLRHSNQALQRIIRTKKLVVSEVPFTCKANIYKLGTYHSTAPPPKEKLPFKLLTSKDFGFPVPEWANQYNEIRIIETLDIGSHMLLWGESSHAEILGAGSGHLYHIHFLSYLYRHRKGIAYPSV
jgi:flavin reductase (DIM6/NTAB) family NADH-FMN oxidoreductase RutF